MNQLVTGEKILDASKVLRQQQEAEYGDVSDKGRKVDLIFKYKDIELSNVEFKRTDISSTDIALHCRQKWLFYQVNPLREIPVAGRSSATMLYLPATSGAMESLLQIFLML
ncbi:hypothetical protein BGZ67_005451 [Mortierella alpina]|nr:hypothetical protein BGZ67_005451 [Mortierella alpina]